MSERKPCPFCLRENIMCEFESNIECSLLHKGIDCGIWIMAQENVELKKTNNVVNLIRLSKIEPIHPFNFGIKEDLSKCAEEQMKIFEEYRKNTEKKWNEWFADFKECYGKWGKYCKKCEDCDDESDCRNEVEKL